MSRETKRYLVFSVVLNLLFVGFFLGTACHGILMDSSRDASHLSARLPDGKRKLLESVMQPSWKAMNDSHATMDAEKEKAQALLRADSFDEAAYLAQIHHISELHMQLRFRMAQSIAQLAKQFTPEERAILAEIISRPPPCVPGCSATGYGMH